MHQVIFRCHLTPGIYHGKNKRYIVCWSCTSGNCCWMECLAIFASHFVPDSYVHNRGRSHSKFLCAMNCLHSVKE